VNVGLNEGLCVPNSHSGSAPLVIRLLTNSVALCRVFSTEFSVHMRRPCQLYLLPVNQSPTKRACVGLIESIGSCVLCVATHITHKDEHCQLPVGLSHPLHAKTVTLRSTQLLGTPWQNNNTMNSDLLSHGC